MNQQIKHIRVLLAQLEAQHDEANRLDCEVEGLSDQAHQAFTLEEDTLEELTISTIELYLSYYEKEEKLMHIGNLLKQL